MNWSSPYLSSRELGANELQVALNAAKQDAERVRAEFVRSLPADSPAYDAEWTTQYGSEDQLIFEFSVVLDLDPENFDVRRYPREAVNRAVTDLRKRLAGTGVDAWGVWIVTVDVRPKPPSDD